MTVYCGIHAGVTKRGVKKGKNGLTRVTVSSAVGSQNGVAVPTQCISAVYELVGCLLTLESFCE